VSETFGTMPCRSDPFPYEASSARSTNRRRGLMSFLTLVLTALGLAADAFAVSVAKGMKMRALVWRPALAMAITFGAFQGLMPVIGWLLGSRLTAYIEPVDHWIAFALLAAIGAKMIWEARGDAREDEGSDDADASTSPGVATPGAATAADATGAVATAPTFTIGVRELMVLGVATSIDALAVGVTFAFLDVHILQAALVIAGVTFVLSLVGTRLGHHAGSWLRSSAEFAGGVVLIGIGVNILVEHLIG